MNTIKTDTTYLKRGERLVMLEALNTLTGELKPHVWHTVVLPPVKDEAWDDPYSYAREALYSYYEEEYLEIGFMNVQENGPVATVDMELIYWDATGAPCPTNLRAIVLS